jgi:hypothetical protein
MHDSAPVPSLIVIPGGKCTGSCAIRARAHIYAEGLCRRRTYIAVIVRWSGKLASLDCIRDGGLDLAVHDEGAGWEAKDHGCVALLRGVDVVLRCQSETLRGRDHDVCTQQGSWRMH